MYQSYFSLQPRSVAVDFGVVYFDRVASSKMYLSIPVA